MPTADSDLHPLLAFNRQMLDQSLALVAAHAGPGAPVYDGPVGAHLRHVIEHWEALVFPAQPGWVDYDARQRDAALAASPVLARQRLLALRAQLVQWRSGTLAAPVQVRGLCGLAGQWGFDAASSLGRELAFVASHAVHHFALLKAHCERHGIAIGADFGKAPATVAHERDGAGSRQPTVQAA